MDINVFMKAADTGFWAFVGSSLPIGISVLACFFSLGQKRIAEQAFHLELHLRRYDLYRAALLFYRCPPVGERATPEHIHQLEDAFISAVRASQFLFDSSSKVPAYFELLRQKLRNPLAHINDVPSLKQIRGLSKSDFSLTEELILIRIENGIGPLTPSQKHLFWPF